MEVIHYENPMHCKSGTCSFCGKFSQLCAEIDAYLVEEWDKNNNLIMCQECDDICWVHERRVHDTPHTACCCGLSMTIENTNNV